MRRTLFAIVVLALTAAPALAAPVGIVVPSPPPTARVERIVRRAPGPTFVWVGGHWTWRGARFEWVHGAWAPPPRPAWVWTPPRWVVSDGRWRFYEGYWHPAFEPPPLQIHQPRGTPIMVSVMPPPPLIESRTEAPQPDAVWIPGYWSWNGRHFVWIGGLWSAPNPGWTWVPPQWERRADGRWQWLPGSWQRIAAGS